MDCLEDLLPKRDLPSAAEEFAAATVVNFSPAPKDAYIIAARNKAGVCSHVCWETHLLEEGQAPCWMEMDSLEPFEIVAWVPSCWTVGEMLEQYPG